MEAVIPYALAGLEAGSLYALVAAGLVLVYRGTGVFNFAHGELATLGAYATATLTAQGVPLLAALVAGMALAGAVAASFHLAVLDPASRRGAGAGTTVILTLALAQLLHALVLLAFGPAPRPLSLGLPDGALPRIADVPIDATAILALAAGLVLTFGLDAAIARTRSGLALRAVAEDRLAAESLGLPGRALPALAWGLSAALAALAGTLLGSRLLLEPGFMLEPFLKGFAAAVLGGLTSLRGAILGGLALGLIEGVVGATLGIQARTATALVILLGLLLLRPVGLFGREKLERF
jgi:branched-chain amino acid transport system permease protein